MNTVTLLQLKEHVLLSVTILASLHQERKDSNDQRNVERIPSGAFVLGLLDYRKNNNHNYFGHISNPDYLYDYFHSCLLFVQNI